MSRTVAWTAAIIAGLFLLALAAWSWWGSTPFFSVEFHLAELSPRGPDGGYAMPASGASNPSGLQFSCSSKGTSVRLSWSRSVYQEALAPGGLEFALDYHSLLLRLFGISTVYAGGGGGGSDGGGSYTPAHNHPVPTEPTYTITVGGKTYTSAGNSIDVSITPSTRYEWSVQASAGGGSSSVVSGTAFTCDPEPTLTFSADEYTVKYGHGTNLHWSSEHTNSCTATGLWTGTRNISGTEPTGALTQKENTYFLQCFGTKVITSQQTPASSGEQRTSVVGYSGGGSSYSIQCPSGTFVSGAQFYSGNYVNQIKFDCTPSGSSASTGWGGQGPTTRSCPAGSEATGVFGRAGKYVDQLGFTCSSGGRTATVGGGGGDAYTLSCPSGTRMVGAYGRSGEWIDQLGLICATASSAATHTSTTVETKTNIVPVTIKVENGIGATIDVCDRKYYVRKDEPFCINYDIGTSEPQFCDIRTGAKVIKSGLEQNGEFDWSITGETTFTLNCEEGGNTASTTVKVLPEFQET